MKRCTTHILVVLVTPALLVPAVASARKLFRSLISIDAATASGTGTNSARNIPDLFSTRSLLDIDAGYLPTDSVAATLDLRGLRARLSYAIGSTELRFRIPGAGIDVSFDAGDRDGSLEQFEEWLQGDFGSGKRPGGLHHEAPAGLRRRVSGGPGGRQPEQPPVAHVRRRLPHGHLGPDPRLGRRGSDSQPLHRGPGRRLLRRRRLGRRRHRRPPALLLRDRSHRADGGRPDHLHLHPGSLDGHGLRRPRPAGGALRVLVAHAGLPHRRRGIARPGRPGGDVLGNDHQPRAPALRPLRLRHREHGRRREDDRLDRGRGGTPSPTSSPTG